MGHTVPLKPKVSQSGGFIVEHSGLNHRIYVFFLDLQHFRPGISRIAGIQPSCPNDFLTILNFTLNTMPDPGRWFHPVFYAMCSARVKSSDSGWNIPEVVGWISRYPNHNPLWWLILWLLWLWTNDIPMSPGVLNTLNRMSVAFRHDHLEMGCLEMGRWGCHGIRGKWHPHFKDGFSSEIHLELWNLLDGLIMTQAVTGMMVILFWIQGSNPAICGRKVTAIFRLVARYECEYVNGINYMKLPTTIRNWMIYRFLFGI